ncbi:MAG TPA: hypothetical protein VK524_16810, partial [Polyangiaceae bacterium]|nr:hypothetical protein [Polyangiaceae bacterium]
MKKLLAWAAGACVVASLAGACGGGDSGGDSDGDGNVRDAGRDSSIIVRPDGSGGGGNCTPLTCEALGATCGPQGDGCGNVIECGNCTAPEVCGAGGPSKCGRPNPNCVAKTCAQLNANCGQQGDGCGNVINCGQCTAGQFCGGGGPSRCGATGTVTDGGTCVPTKTACAAGDCGPIGNGCGVLLNCSTTCPAGQICGGAGVPSRCGGSGADGGGVVCQARTCAQLNANCGQQGNGCGGLTPSCGSCPTGQICGGGGVASRCGP